MKKRILNFTIPNEASDEEVEKAGELLKKLAGELFHRDQAMRGYLAAANANGFSEYAPPLCSVERLQELTIRAFWYSFSKIIDERTARFRRE